MKTKLLFLFLLLSLPSFSQTNLVPNGDFENWSASSQPISWFRDFNGLLYQSSSAQSGASSTSMELTGANKTSSFMNSTVFPVETGKTYRVTLYHKVETGTFTSLELRLTHNIFKDVLIKKTDATFSTSEWRKIEFDYTSTVDENIEVAIWAYGTPNGRILLDNVSVIDVTAPVLQYTAIPDPNFEKKLIALGLDSGTVDGKVLTSNIQSETSLDVSQSNISDLTGIQDFTSLTDLNCSTNALTSINVSSNVKLENLQVAKNKLTDLNISTNILLKYLYCSNNLLTSIDVSSNVKLESLLIANNQLASLNVSTNILLKYLYCAINKLTSLDVSSLVSLIELDCGVNKLTTLNVDTNISLQDLRCPTNQLTSINVSKNTKLYNFFCHQNLISNVNLSSNPLLDGFICYENKLTSLDVSNNTKLTMLDCFDNKITSLDISKNPLIYELACENNQLTYLNLKNGNNTILRLAFSKFVNNPALTCILVDDVNYSNTKWSAIKDATAIFSTTCALGLEDSVFDKVVMYPNPTKGEVNINNIALDKVTVYNSTGQLVKSYSLNSGDTSNKLDLSGLTRGIYYLYLINQDAASAKKIIVE